MPFELLGRRKRLAESTLAWLMCYATDRHAWTDVDYDMQTLGKTAVLPWPICAVCGAIRSTANSHKKCPGPISDRVHKPADNNPWVRWRRAAEKDAKHRQNMVDKHERQKGEKRNKRK